MTTPGFLLVELRIAFRCCARQQQRLRAPARGFQTFNCLLKRNKNTPKNNGQTSKAAAAGGKDATSSETSESRSKALPSIKPTSNKASSTGPPAKASVLTNSESRQLIPSPKEPSSVSSARKWDVPVKVLPKAQLTPELTITPKERLHIEWMTRKPPKPEPPKLYKSRLLIYHGGLARWRFLSILKVATIFVLCGFVVVVAPAYYAFGYPLWAVALIFLGGSIPFLLVNFTTRPFVTWIYLVLPLFARQSPKAALDYSRNLPANATLQISFMRGTTLPAQVEVNVADLVPSKSPWRPVTFEWVGNRVDKGTWYRPNPTGFYVRPESGKGREARDTVPGIWENVYKRIMGEESETVAKWRK